jgi:hypothetical protein
VPHQEHKTLQKQGKPTESGGDIQATTKVVDSRSLKSSPPEISGGILCFLFATLAFMTNAVRR